MPPRESKDKPRKATRRRRASAARGARAGRFTPEPAAAESPSEARALYHHEKARRSKVTRPPDHPLEQARRAYQALLAADAEKAKGGRPRKNAAPPSHRRAGSPPGRDDEADAES